MVANADEPMRSSSVSTGVATSSSTVLTNEIGGNSANTSNVRSGSAEATVGVGATSLPTKSLPQGATSSGTATGYEEAEEDGILDLTSSQLHNLKEVELPATLVELDLTANRLTELDDRIGQMSMLKKLSLRQNLFEDSAVEALTKWPAVFGLQELVLRDNRLTRIPVVSAFTNLVLFDVSYNKINSMMGLSKACPSLREVYLSSNAIQKVEELDHLQELQILELGSNKLRRMDGIQKLTQLKELWLGRNRLATVNMCGLTSLTRISVQSNHLSSMLGFEACVLLEELYLSHNDITEMEGLSTVTKLRILDVSSNKLEAIKNIQNLSRLEDLWLNDNIIPTLDGIEADLEGVKNSLTVIYLERNPCSRNNPDYVNRLRKMLPKLVQIDSQFFD